MTSYIAREYHTVQILIYRGVDNLSPPGLKLYQGDPPNLNQAPADIN